MLSPVRPPPSCSDDNEGEHHQAVDELEEEVDLSKAMLDDPIVGVEQVNWDENGPGARKPRALPLPRSMTPAEKEEHDLTHLPFDNRCEICVATRGLNAQHRSAVEQLRVIPLLVADYCFLRFSTSSITRTVLVMRLYPYRLFFGCVVPRKGADPLVVKKLANFIRDSGLSHFVYRCDREHAIGSIIDESCSLLGRSAQKVTSDDDRKDLPFPVAVVEDDEPDAPTEVPKAPAPEGPLIMVPELTHPGESQSNGLAERSVGILEDFVRTTILALRVNIGVSFPADHPLVDWAVQHSAYLLNKYSLGTDGRTAYGRLHGAETKERICQFGERILWFVPKRLRGKLDQRYRYGIFLVEPWEVIKTS